MSPSASRRPERRHAAMAGLACLLAAVAAVYWPGLRAPFLFDDHTVILGNVNLATLWPRTLTARWIVDMSFALNVAMHGFAPAGFRAVNIAIHLGATALLFGALRRTARHAPRLALPAPRADGFALLGAAIWGLHPLQTQSVTYICQRYEALMGLFFLGALYAFTRGIAVQEASVSAALAAGNRPDAARGGAARWWFNGTIGAAMLGMGAKEVMAALPPVLLLLDRLLWADSWRTLWRRRGCVHVALGLTWGILALLTLRMLGAGQAMEQVASGGVSAWSYFLTQGEVILHYLRLVVWPVGLCLDYGDWPLAATLRAALPGVLGTGSILAAGLLAWRHRPAFAFVTLSFFITLAPSSSFVALPDLAFEHRMYLPLAFVAALLGMVGLRIAWRGGGARLAAPLGAAAVLALGALTVARNTVYGSERTMWADVVAQRPHNMRARIDYAVALAETGAFEAARGQLETVLQHMPADERERLKQGALPPGPFATRSWRYHAFRAHANLGQMYRRSGDPERARHHFRLALNAAPGHPLVASMRDALRREQEGERPQP